MNVAQRLLAVLTISLPFAIAACGGDAAPADAGDAGASTDLGAPDLGGGDDLGTDAGPAHPFQPGGGGTDIGALAGDLTLPTTAGDFSLSGSWDGDTSYVFTVFSPGSADSDQLFRSNIAYLIYPGMPPRAHYFFLAYSSAAAVLPGLAARADEALAMLDPAEADVWRAHLHFVTSVDARSTGTWVDAFLTAHPVRAFAIDRLQHLRNVGSLAPFTGSGFVPSLSALRFEPQYFDFEYDRAQRLLAEHATVVTGLTALTTRGERWGWSDPTMTANEPVFFDATFPPAATMATFDTLEVDLVWSCIGHDETRCNEWDRLLDLYLCPDGMAGAGCGTRDAPNQVARWITSYHREGRWVTDITPMLARFLAGGTFHFYLNTPQVDRQTDPMILDLTFRLSNQGKPYKPMALRTFAAGEHTFDTTYDGNYPDTTFTAPAGATHAEIVSIITGHGQDGNGCAEFCDHQHHFGVNGHADHVLEFTDPDTAQLSGCSAKVGAGVVPNQFGTWNLGRGGWCPGFDVAPQSVDVTSELHLDGTSNTGHYAATFRGAPYTGSTMGSGNLVVSSFLVYYH